MRKFEKPVVVLSKCLEFEACRYNGQVIPDSFVKKLIPHVDFMPVCPEVEIGLGTPREPIRLVEEKEKIHLMQSGTLADVTYRMTSFSKKYLDSLEDVDGFILKSRSPSCGLKEVSVYRSLEKSASIGKRTGLFAEAVLNTFPGLAIEDEGRLLNLKIREHFLAKLFTLSEFRKIKKSHAMKDLVRFHTVNKFLFMAYNQKEMRILGQIVANAEKKPIDHVLREYEIHLKSTMSHIPRFTSNINVMMHALGFFSEGLSAKEKTYFLDMLEKYRMSKVPLGSLLSILRSWIVRFDTSYLRDQTFFEQYPEDLVELIDTSKGREVS